MNSIPSTKETETPLTEATVNDDLLVQDGFELINPEDEFIIPPPPMSPILESNTNSEEELLATERDKYNVPPTVARDSDNELTKKASDLPIFLPKSNYLYSLFAAWIVSSSLAFFSALDAVRNCAEETTIDFWNWNLNTNVQEDDYYNNYDDAELMREEDAQQCHSLFWTSIVPICPVVIILSCIACQWTLKDNSKWDYMDDTDVPSTIVTKNMNKDQSRLLKLRAHAHTQHEHLKSCIRLLLVSLLCLGLWLYAYRTIWDQSDEPFLSNNVDNSLFQMRYTSLGAINAFGEVGQNANLYYSIWLSLGIGMAIVYEMVLMTHSQWKTTTACQNELNMVAKTQKLQAFGVEVMMTWSKTQKHLINEKRSAWYKSLYKLRFRTGIWISALIASLVVYFSSKRYWSNSVYPEAVAAGQVDDGADDADVCNVFGDYFTIAMHAYYGHSYPSICARTKASKWTGLISASLSFCAVLSHYYFHNLVERETESPSRLLEAKRDRMQWLEKRRELIPLNIEFISASVATTLLGCNAVFATAVGGPAPSVGDLYYSSWISFVLMMRITLGCLSDILDEREELALQSLGQDESIAGGSCISLPQTPKSSRRMFLTNNLSFSPSNRSSLMLQKVLSTRIVPMTDTYSLSHTPSKRSGVNDEISGSSYFGGLSFRRTSNILEQGVVKEEEASRTIRLTRWASVSIFSFIFLLSASDAVSYKKFYCHFFTHVCE